MEILRKENWLNVAIFGASALIAAIGQPDRGLWLALFAYLFGYTGLFFVLRRLSQYKIATATVWATLVFGFQLSWLATTHYHGIGIVFVYALAVFVFSIPFGFLFGLGITREFSWRRSVALSAAWVLLEWCRLFILCGFPFSSVGLVLTAHPILMQMASVLGIYGLSFWVIFASYTGAFGRVYCFLLPLVVSLPHLYYWQGREGTKLDIALVQTGLSAEQRWKYIGGEVLSAEEQWNHIYSLLRGTNRERFDLIVLPEVAVTGETAENFVKAEQLALLYQSEVVIGLVDEQEDKTYNAAFHIVPQSSVKERYEKRILVPGAEYLPLDLLRSLLAQYGIHSFFTPGDEAKVFLGKVPFAVSICYEEGFSGLIRESRMRGAQLLVNVSNDGWFPNSRLPEEHFNLGRVRAVENGVFVLRACNTGVTAVIDPFGKVLCSMGENEGSGVQIASIMCASYPTLFSYWGNLPLLLFCACAVMPLFLDKKIRLK